MWIELKEYRLLNGACLRVLNEPTVKHVLRIYGSFIGASVWKIVLDEHGEDLLAALLIGSHLCVEFQFEGLL